MWAALGLLSLLVGAQKTGTFNAAFPQPKVQSFPSVPKTSFAPLTSAQTFAPLTSAQALTTQSFAPVAPAQSFASSSGANSNIDAAYTNLYDAGKFHSVNMVINPTNLALMKKDPKQELKVPCDVTMDYQTPQAQTYSSSNLACGYKGSVGALRVCFDAYGKFSPDDCRKPSYKIDADYFNPQADDRIAGVKRLMFHGAPADWSMIAERMAFTLLKQWGIPAPTANHASLYQNGQFLGVFVFVSTIDDIFTREHFGTDSNQGRGGLYKEAWFNPVHMANLAETFKSGKNEDAFMRQIESAMEATPLTQQAAQQFFDTYFDVDSLVDVTAANTVLGNTDDWRQRHNMYWYIREDANGKKAVLIPWDYDRLNDAGAATRGALKGRPWWDANTQMYCNNRLRTAAERGAIKGGADQVQAAYWTDIFEATPPDVEIPVSCDRIAQLMALALGTRIRQRTRELAATLNRATMQSYAQTWSNQISSALSRDPDGPQAADMANEQRSLIDNIFSASQKAVTDANNGDRGISSAPALSSTGTTFVPKAQAAAVGSDAYKYKVGEVISQTFTPVSPSALAASLSAAGFVPKTSQASTPVGYVPKTTQPPQTSTPVGYVPKTTQQPASAGVRSSGFTVNSQQSAFSFPSQSQSSFSQPSFSQTSFLPSSQFSQSSQFSSFSSSFSQPSLSQPSYSPQFSSSTAAATPRYQPASSFSSWGR